MAGSVSLFAENFWDKDDIKKGFSILSNHMRRGRKECQDLFSLVKERLDAEEEYSKKLSKISKSNDDEEGFGFKTSEDSLQNSLTSAYKQIKHSSEELSKKHKEFATNLNKEILQPLNNLKESQKKMVDDLITKVNEAQKEFQNARNQVPNVKKTYEMKCKEFDNADMELSAAQSNSLKNEKIIPKLQTKVTKLKKEVESCDQQYQQAVDRHEDSRLKWEESMTDAASVFEGLEINRISKMKDFLSTFQQLEQKMTMSYEIDIGKIGVTFIECIKHEIDIEIFVSECRTGWSRPGPCLYENYYTGLKKDAAFGVDLEVHLTNSGRPVPEILELCANRIEKSLVEEGLYRLSGRTAKVQHLRSLFDKNRAAVNLDDNDVHTNDVASLLKLYIRELPKPLMTYQLYDQIMSTARDGDPANRVKKMNQIVRQLPDKNRTTMIFLLKHLKKVSEYSDKNKMTASNLAIVFAPGIIRSEDDSNGLRDFKFQSTAMEDMILNREEIFGE